MAHGPPTAEQMERVRLAALRLLETRARSRAELTERLLAKKLPTAAVEAVVSRFVELGLVNDRALAEDVVRGESGRLPAGEALLRHRLERHRIDDELVDQALGALEADAPAHVRARALAEAVAARLPGSLGPVARWRRVLSALARRGFDEETALAAAEHALGEMPEG